MELVKMIWDFRGPNAKPIASHHEIHLREFVQAEALEDSFTGTESVSDSLYMAYLVTPKKYVETLRKKLNPHRGQLYRP